MGFVARNVYRPTHVAVCQETQTTFVQPTNIRARCRKKEEENVLQAEPARRAASRPAKLDAHCNKLARSSIERS